MQMRNFRIVSILVVVVAAVMTVQAQQPAPVNMITAEELKAKMTRNEPVTIIDVRSAEGFANSSTTVKGSIHFKLRKLKSRLRFAPLKDLARNAEIVRKLNHKDTETQRSVRKGIFRQLWSTMSPRRMSGHLRS
jgi:hypothetical protein